MNSSEITGQHPDERKFDLRCLNPFPEADLILTEEELKKLIAEKNKLTCGENAKLKTVS